MNDSQRSRRPCLTMVLAAAVTMILFGSLCGLTLRVIYRPPFLTWQHGAEFTEPVEAYFRDRFSIEWRARVVWVKEYTETCSVVRVAMRNGENKPEGLFWVLLFRAEADKENAAAWTANYAEGDSNLTPALTWGSVCGEGAGGLTLPDLEPLKAATFIAP